MEKHSLMISSNYKFYFSLNNYFLTSVYFDTLKQDSVTKLSQKLLYSFNYSCIFQVLQINLTLFTNVTNRTVNAY